MFCLPFLSTFLGFFLTIGAFLFVLPSTSTLCSDTGLDDCIVVMTWSKAEVDSASGSSTDEDEPLDMMSCPFAKNRRGSGQHFDGERRVQGEVA